MDAHTQDVINRRAAAVKKARTDLLAYLRLLHADPADPADPDKTLYHTARHHQLIADALQDVESGKSKRLIISLPPRHGKTEEATKGFVPWYLGKHPDRSCLVATYSDNFAIDLGRGIRANIEHPATTQVFPKLKLKSDARAGSRMETTKKGLLATVGRGSALTGRGGHLLLVDDPLKDRKEADSPTIRNQLWSWFNQVFMTRQMTDEAAVIVIQTRWHDDDLIGRLTDPRNTHYNAREAKKWRFIDLPAIARENDVLGRKPGQALWPKRFGLKYLKSMQGQDPRGFSALYQGRPSPEDGAFFEEHQMTQFAPLDMPKPEAMRWYMASDHAVSISQEADKNCIMLFGVDEYSTIWIHPQLTWQKMASDQIIESALWLVDKYKPLMWFAERGVIEKSIGPFLRKRMIEKQVFVSIRTFTPVTDKMARAQSIQARMATGLVRFPGYANWWPDAKHELLTFPYGSNDDFVDTLSLVGLGLDSLSPGAGNNPIRTNLRAKAAPAFGTAGWVKEYARREDRARRFANRQGW